MSSSDIAAWWGASIATIVLILDIYKWLTKGPKLGMTLTGNMVVIGNPNRENITWVSVVISNIGEQPTTLKVIGLKYYKSYFDRLRGKCSFAATFPNPNDTHPLPQILKSGEEWTGLVPQEREDKNLSLIQMAQEGHLIIVAGLSHTSKELKKRLIIKESV